MKYAFRCADSVVPPRGERAGREVVTRERAIFMIVGITVALWTWAVGKLAAEATELRLPESSVPLFVRVPAPERAALRPGDLVGLREMGGAPADPSNDTVDTRELVGWVLPAVDADGLPRSDKLELLVVLPPVVDEVTAQNPDDSPGESSAPAERLLVLTGVVSRGRSVGRPEDLAAVTTGDSAGFSFTLDATRLVLLEGGRPILVYNHAPVTAEWVPVRDPRRTRACYIHPVFGLDGELLTDDFPRDHYHHHGIFWTWPHIRIDEAEYDLWADRGIRQQFRQWLGLWSGVVAARFGVENGWYVDDRVVMIERVWVTVWRTQEAGRFLDFELFFQPVDRPVTLWGAPEKSYGGMTMRFRVRPNRPVTITVPDGVTTEDLLETRLRWADLSSQFGEDDRLSGATLFIRPDHPDFPPTWLTRHYGPLCVGWPGVEPRTLEVGHTVRLPYRVWIHRGLPSVDDIERLAQALAAELKAGWSAAK